jgi:hypothetical protein
MMIQEGYSPSLAQHKFPPPSELWISVSLLGGFSTRFPLHKGVPSSLNIPSVTSLTNVSFYLVSTNVQPIVASFREYESSLFRVIINISDKPPHFFQKSPLCPLFPQSMHSKLYDMYSISHLSAFSALYSIARYIFSMDTLYVCDLPCPSLIVHLLCIFFFYFFLLSPHLALLLIFPF